MSGLNSYDGLSGVPSGDWAGIDGFRPVSNWRTRLGSFVLTFEHCSSFTYMPLAPVLDNNFDDALEWLSRAWESSPASVGLLRGARLGERTTD